MRAYPPFSSHTDRGRKEHLSGTNLFKRWNEKLETYWFIWENKNLSDLKRLKNNEIQQDFRHPLSSAVILDEEHGDYSPHPWSPESLSFSGGTQLPDHRTHGQRSETYFYQSEVRSSNLLVFLFSHIAFIFLMCAYCTLDSGYVW